MQRADGAPDPRAALLLQPEGPTAPSPPPPLLAVGLCWRRMTPPNPGALAAAGDMLRADGASDPRADGAPGPPEGSPVSGREAAVGTKRHSDGSPANGDGASAAQAPRAPGECRRLGTNSAASAQQHSHPTALRRRHTS